MTSFNIDQWLSGEEGTRVVEVMVADWLERVGRQDANQIQLARQDYRAALRAALSLTTRCATCHGTGFIKEPDWDSPNVSAVGVPMKPCPDCKGGTVPGEPTLLGALVERVIDPLGSVWEDSPIEGQEVEYDEDGEELPRVRVSHIVKPAYLYRLRPLEKEDETS